MKDNDFVAKGQRGLLDKVWKFAGGGGGAELSHLDKGDTARDRRDWPTAVLHYRDALEEQPGLRHIWIQLGHAEKENGDLDAAEAAYRRAEDLGRGDGEPALHLGHVAKLRGDLAEAKRLYLRAIDDNPDHPDAMRELASFVGNGEGGQRGFERALQRRAKPEPGKTTSAAAIAAIESLITYRRGEIDPATLDTLKSAKKALATIGDAAYRTGDEAEARSTACHPLVFDATDLIAYFKDNRLPTGIQRVQIELISSALLSRSDVRVCSFAEASDHWIDVPAPLFLELCALATSSGDKEDREWKAAIGELNATLALGWALKFDHGAFLVNLGTSWWIQNYFLYVREAKERFAIRYVPFVHDLIPIMTPAHCVKELVKDFVEWTSGVFLHADFFLVNSKATKADLLKAAATLGREVDADRVVPIPLDADFSSARPTHGKLARPALSKWKLRGGDYVLFVSTIETRKNHALAFDAWLELIARHGASNVPTLLCVGKDGWLNEEVYGRLEQDDVLRERVNMLSGLSDEELALLYEHCLFTLYPSHYEGWGLPVTESLCYGKVPLIADNSSLPEAGGEFAAYFASGSLRELIDGLERLIFDKAFRNQREAQIKNRFKPRGWAEIATQIQTALDVFARTATDQRPVRFPYPASLGEYHQLGRSHASRIWKGYVSAEIFRAGSGWGTLEDHGCRIKPKGAKLRMRVPEGSGPLRAYFLLNGVPDKDCRFTIDINDGAAYRFGTLRAGEMRWITVDIPANIESGLIEVMFKGTDRADLAAHTDNLDKRIVSLGVGGFFLCETGDVLTRLAITEAIALRDEVSMAFNRRRTPGEDQGYGGETR